MQGDERVVLDGILDEPVWTRAKHGGEFIQQDPVLGAAPTERTEVRVVFSQDHLYIGVICFDSEPDKLQGNTSKRDEFLSADDRFMWTMDTFLNQQTGYFFEMNPAGLMADALMGPGGTNNREWDGIWNARVRQSEIGWVIEIDIPFRSIAFDPNAPAWGINFQRTVRRKQEELMWTGYQRNQGLRRMANAGLLTGLRDVSSGKGFELKPYLLGLRRRCARPHSCRGARRQRRHRWRGGLQRDAEPAGGGHHQHRLRGDGGRSTARQPDAVPAVLPGEAQLLPRRRDVLRLSDHRVLLPAHRPGQRTAAIHRRRRQDDRAGGPQRPRRAVRAYGGRRRPPCAGGGLSRRSLAAARAAAVLLRRDLYRPQHAC